VFFAWDVRIPKTTPKTSPVTQILKLSKGVISRLDVHFPAGCLYLVGMRLFRWEFQLVPLSRNEWLVGEDGTVPTEPYYELEEVPAQLKLVAYNDDDTYDHTLRIWVSVVPREVAAPHELMRDIAVKLGQVILP